MAFLLELTVGGLRFRELESFNKTLVAKQCWRVLTKPDSIAVLILKDKYLKHTDVLDAKLGNSLSMI